MPRRKQRRLQPVDVFKGSKIRAVMHWLVTAKIAGLVLLFDPLALQSFDLPKTVFSHATAWPLLALLVVALWRFGWGILPRSPLHLAVGVLAGIWVAAAMLGADRYLALYGDSSRYEGLTYLADMLVLYGAIAVAFREPRDYVLPGIVLAGVSGLVLAYAFVQRLGADPVTWDVDPAFRPFSVFGNSDVFGHFLSATFGVAVGVLYFASGRGSRTGRYLAAVLVLVVLIAAALAATRGTLVGVSAVIISLPIVALRIHGVNRDTVARLVVGGSVALVALVALLLLSPLGERALATLQGVGTRDRIVIYEAAVSATRDRPILGWGPDSFSPAFPAYRNPDPAAGTTGNQPESSAHNSLLQAAVTTGLVGLAALVAVVAIGSERLLRKATLLAPAVAGPLLLGWAGYWAHSLVSVGSISIDWYSWATLGATVGLTANRHEAREIRRMSVGAMMVPLAIASLCAAAGWTALDAAHLGQVATTALRAKKADLAVSAARAATNADPGRVGYWELLGLAYDARQQWRDSGDAFAEAARRAPYLASEWSNLARSRARQALGGDQTSGGASAALDAAKHGAAVDPKNWEAQSVLGEVQSAFGQYAAALQTIVRAVRLNPTNPNNDAVAAEAAMRITDPGAARASLEQILVIKESVVVRVALAEVALRLNDREAALANARRALELDPTNLDAARIVASMGG